MAKRTTTPSEMVTPSLIRFREKKKWQIAFRRYVLEQNTCVAYAPYFGLDIKSIRSWFEYQFPVGIGWQDFGTQWQFEHVIPVACFNFEEESELKLCWNFTNIRVEMIEKGSEGGIGSDLFAARTYFTELLETTQYQVCRQMLDKISRIELSQKVHTGSQQAFIRENRSYIDQLEGFTAFEFELLNTGRSLEEVKKESEFFKKYK